MVATIPRRPVRKSDFEGALVPEDLGGVSGMPRLVSDLKTRGYNDEEVDKLTHRNWLRIIGDTW
jgi:membrane dipeptidase